MRKRCTVCKQKKSIKEFYKMAAMSDGHLNQCKECKKKDVRKRRSRSREKIAAYEKERSQRASRRAYVAKKQKEHRTKNPDKYRARTAVGNAVRDGRLVRLPCKFCGDKRSQAHHHDYSRPLDVTWMCFRCHRERGHGQVVN